MDDKLMLVVLVVDDRFLFTVDSSILQGSFAVMREYSVPNNRMAAVTIMKMRG
jgi:hypothetical protein